jgi:hypothetical protein
LGLPPHSKGDILIFENFGPSSVFTEILWDEIGIAGPGVFPNSVICEDYSDHRALEIKAYITHNSVYAEILKERRAYHGEKITLFAAYLKKKGESWPGRKIKVNSPSWTDLNCNPSWGRSVIIENNGPSDIDIQINRKFNPRSFILKSGEQCSESFSSSDKNIENIKVKITEKNKETSLTIIELPAKY